MHSKRAAPILLLGKHQIKALHDPVACTRLDARDSKEPKILLFSDLHNVPVGECDGVPMWSLEFLRMLDELGSSEEPVVLGIEGELWHVGTLAAFESPESMPMIAQVYRDQAASSTSVLQKVDYTLRRCVALTSKEYRDARVPPESACPLANTKVLYAHIREFGSAGRGAHLKRFYWDYLLLESLNFASAPWSTLLAQDATQGEKRLNVWRSVLREVASALDLSPASLLDEFKVAATNLCSFDKVKVEKAMFPSEPHSRASLLTKELRRVEDAQAWKDQLTTYGQLDFQRATFGEAEQKDQDDIVQYVDVLFASLTKSATGKAKAVDLPRPSDSLLKLLIWAGAAYMDAYFLLRAFGKHQDSRVLCGFFGHAHIQCFVHFFANIRETHTVGLFLDAGLFSGAEEVLEPRCLRATERDIRLA